MTTEQIRLALKAVSKGNWHRDSSVWYLREMIEDARLEPFDVESAVDYVYDMADAAGTLVERKLLKLCA
jgi:hypothetical protein